MAGEDAGRFEQAVILNINKNSSRLLSALFSLDLSNLVFLPILLKQVRLLDINDGASAEGRDHMQQSGVKKSNAVNIDSGIH